MHSLFHYCHHYYYPGCHCHLSELLWKPANCRLHYPPSAKVKLKSNYTLKTYIQFVIIVVHSLSHVWLCDPIDCRKPGFPVLHHLLEFAQTHVHWVSDAIQPSHPLSPPSPSALNLSSIRVFANESVLRIRRPKYWSFSISPSNEFSGLISFRIDWFDLLAVQGTLKSLL